MVDKQGIAPHPGVRSFSRSRLSSDDVSEAPTTEPGFPILGVSRLNGQPKRDDDMIFGSCKAIQLRNVRARPSESEMARFGGNAHVRRGLSDSSLWDGFWLFGGSSRSRRFERAVPVGREIATATFTSASGWPWRWDGGRTPLQVIGSYTRSCRCVIDPSLPDHSERADTLWEWIKRHSGAARPGS